MVSKVSLVRDNEISEGLNRALDLVGGLKKLVDGKKVLIKINLVNKRPPESGAICDPRVLGYLIDRCYDDGAAEVVVGDGPGCYIEEVLKVNPVDMVSKEHRAELIDLNHATFRVVEVEDPLLLDSFLLSEPVLEAEVLINLAKLKTHRHAGVTLSMKNLMGCVPGRGYRDEKGVYVHYDFSYRKVMHESGLHEALVDLNTLIYPALNIIDGFIAHEGESPSAGTAVDMRTFIVGTDKVAVDVTGARVMGYNPISIDYIKYVIERSMGNPNPLVKGYKVDEIKKTFKPPKSWEGKIEASI